GNALPDFRQEVRKGRSQTAGPGSETAQGRLDPDQFRKAIGGFLIVLRSVRCRGGVVAPGSRRGCACSRSTSCCSACANRSVWSTGVGGIGGARLTITGSEGTCTRGAGVFRFTTRAHRGGSSSLIIMRRLRRRSTK